MIHFLWLVLNTEFDIPNKSTPEKLVSFETILVSSLSIPIEVSFKHNFEHCILLITKSFELLMFTQVVRN